MRVLAKGKGSEGERESRGEGKNLCMEYFVECVGCHCGKCVCFVFMGGMCIYVYDFRYA